ncbi:hypothetical protein [Stigmatella aurantiaca]|uniref:DUF4325 domain-containing protein n=1 Tax=Stigmatella aurantiaca (strain DW4/3-1) TaxID=378806 RepID=E3FGA7_STIAD|nr:hypothetical protein [Stigmatella aurantiaca]ADO70242.1 uncharacterized protein STAUR_2438 [Stigmatella aurantiaca DW4/3-1]
MFVYSLLSRHEGVSPQLYGATLGQAHYKGLISTIQGALAESVVVVDFSGVEATTASYLKATVIALLEAAMDSVNEPSRGGPATVSKDRVNVFPVVSNLSPEVAEELQTVLEARRLPYLEALRISGTEVTQARLRGFIEAAPAETLERVVTARSTSATQLATLQSPPTATGWSNRLADLFRLRLVRRIKEGRNWLYSPVVSEVSFG